MRHRTRHEREQPELFRALPGNLAPRDAQDLMAYPFFSLARVSASLSPTCRDQPSASLRSTTSAAPATMDQRGQERDQMDPAVVPFFCRQRQPPSAPRVAYLGNFMRTLAMPKAAEPWS
jgi:hypothetical protein